MKIGILSMHRVINTGSFLQAYALKKMLEKNGEVSFLDIKNPKNINGMYTPYSPFWKRKIKLFIWKRKKAEIDYFHSKRWDMFVYELFEELGFGLEYHTNSNEYDLVIVGSDEVFNCTQEDSYWFGDMTFFGEGIESNFIATYAASFGYTTIERLEKFQLKADVAKGLDKMLEISVRDKNSKQIVERLINKKVYFHLDPFLVYDYSDLMPKKIKDKNFILVYSYDNRLKEEEYILEIKKFAKNKNLKTISVNFYQEWCDKNIVMHPFEVLSYFKNAEYVVTDTFHGAVMSIKFQKQFLAIVRDTNMEKLVGLLEYFHLEDRIWNQPVNMENQISRPIDQDGIRIILNREREKTREYLDNICKLVEKNID